MAKDRPVILVIEVDGPTRDLLRELLAYEAGYLVHTATDRHEALRVLVEIHIDMVVMELPMPVAEALDLCRAARSIGVADLRVLILTAWGERYREEAIRAGADAYLTKPFELDELLDFVRVLLVSRVGDGTAMAQPSGSVAPGPRD
jgi:two-component system OmpR family response regulator